MRDHLIDFENMPWIKTGNGVRCKIFNYEDQQMRLVEFSEGFAETDWCARGHAGYVLEGSFAIDFNAKLERYKEGDVIFIPQNREDRHKSVLGKGERVLLLLFEIV